ncbi:hypothetical protein IEQ34_008462 [Dendrobium chrysotoxum]|uniref:EF-hand domain-containing protein n=1 Tax=Dendrobium chrysotoxum TaxID=161865 RepID=A0AAV7GWL7_DENCH|nr:hypothetical protein IEQ34_008462 [Dendrobium chrysotoxum]
MTQLQNASIISEFINNEKFFKASVEKTFASLDTNNDGFISFAEMAKELISLKILKTSLDVDGIALSHVELKELRRDIFTRFDRDGSMMVDLEEFQEEMREMIVAVANSLKNPKRDKPWDLVQGLYLTVARPLKSSKQHGVGCLVNPDEGAAGSGGIPAWTPRREGEGDRANGNLVNASNGRPFRALYGELRLLLAEPRSAAF